MKNKSIEAMGKQPGPGGPKSKRGAFAWRRFFPGLLMVAAGLVALSSLAAPPLGYYQVWNDEFDGSSLNGGKWVAYTGAHRDGICVEHQHAGDRRPAAHFADGQPDADEPHNFCHRRHADNLVAGGPSGLAAIDADERAGRRTGHELDGRARLCGDEPDGFPNSYCEWKRFLSDDFFVKNAMLWRPDKFV